jgi:type VI secretion system protein
MHRPSGLKKGLLLILSLSILLGGCGIFGSSSASKTRLKTKILALDVSPQANLNHPIALDLVVIYNQVLFKDLLGVSAEEWFKKRHQYKLDYPSVLQSWEWELVPNQVVPFFKLPSGTSKAVGAIVYANYATPGNHRARIDPYEGVVVRLQNTQFKVLPLE